MDIKSMQANRRVWLIGIGVAGALVLGAVISVAVIYGTTSGRKSKEKLQEKADTGQKHRHEVPSPGPFPDYEPYSDTAQEDSLWLEDVLKRSDGFDIWQLATDAQRQIIMDQKIPAREEEEGKDKVEDRKWTTLQRAQSDLQFRQECLQLLELPVPQPPPPNEPKPDCDRAFSESHLLLECYKLAGRLDLPHESVVTRLKQWTVARDDQYILIAWWQKLWYLNSDPLRLTPSEKRHIERMYQDATTAMAELSPEEAVEFMRQSCIESDVMLIILALPGNGFEDYMQRTLRLIFIQKALVSGKPLIQDLQAFGHFIPNDFAVVVAETFAFPIEEADWTLTIGERWRRCLEGVDFGAMLLDFATFINDRIDQVADGSMRLDLALMARRALSFQPTDDRDFGYSPTMRFLREQSQLGDPGLYLSAVTPPKPIMNTHGNCYADAGLQCLANLLPLFEQQLARAQAYFGGVQVDEATMPGMAKWFRILRDLNRDPHVLYNQNDELGFFKRSGQVMDVPQRANDEWSSCRERLLLPISTTQTFSATLFSPTLLAAGPLLVISQFYYEGNVHIPLTLDNVPDGWSYEGPGRPRTRRMHLRALGVGTQSDHSSHAWAYVQRRDGSWWHCNDANIQPAIDGPPHITDRNMIYTYFYLEA